MRRRIISLLLVFTMCFTLFLSATNIGSAQTFTGNRIGSLEGYNYELWKDYGTTSMTLNSGGAFSCKWSNIGNALFRRGKKFDQTKTHQQLGNISVNYGCNYQPNGNSYLCVYGWTTDPLIEYYIVESWGSWRPPGGTSKGTITVDGGTYDIYETTRVNQPSIEGTKTFKQYWSVRTSKRTSGTISVSEHFNAWEKKGMTMGNMYEVALTIEGFHSSGSADVYTNTLTLNGEDVASSSLNPSYAIIYWLNGGTNHKSNPQTYEPSNFFQFYEPTRKGYVFEGWYLDAKFKIKVEAINEGITGNLPLYAKWKKVTVSKVSIHKATNQKKQRASLILRKKDRGMKGYEFEYSTNRKFPKSKKKVVKTKKTNTTIKRLSRGKTYYFRARAYQMDSANKKVYGKWSSVKKLKIVR